MSPLADERWTRIQILCVHHPDQVIAEWSTADGRQAMVEAAPSMKSAFIGWVPDDKTRQRMSQTGVGAFLRTAVAAPKAGDQTHWRYTFPCHLPSCSYHPEIRSEHCQRLDAMVLAMWAAQAPDLLITNLEQTLADWARRSR